MECRSYEYEGRHKADRETEPRERKDRKNKEQQPLVVPY